MGLNSRYEIRVKGILDGRWTARFENLRRPRRSHQEKLMHPVTMRQLAAARPPARPINNTDQARKESEK